MNRFNELLEVRLKKDGEFSRSFDRIANAVKGQSSLNIMAALNAMVTATDGAYLEIGTMYGRTLCGAMVGNGDRTFAAVDSAPTGVSETNVRRLFPDVDLRFHRMSFYRFFREQAGKWRGRVSAYFYDAEHSLMGQRDGLRLAVESGVLAAEAFVAVDDYSWADTKQAVGEFLATRPEWKVVLKEEDDWNRRGWWNGLVVIYRSGRDSERPKEVR